VCAAAKANLPVVIANTYHVHNFAVSTGKRAKTDKLDAKMIAHYGEALKPRLSEIKPDNIQQISDSLVRRAQLIDMRTMEKNRLSILPKTLHRSIKKIINTLQKEVEHIEETLDELMKDTAQWQELKEILLSVKGAGKVLAYTLMSDLPELGQLNRKSGAYKDKRKTKGGRHLIRAVLFMSMLSWIQSNPKFKDIYTSMVAAGKPKKAAIIAWMRRLITILNTIVKNNTAWDEKLV